MILHPFFGRGWAADAKAQNYNAPAYLLMFAFRSNAASHGFYHPHAWLHLPFNL